MGLQIRRKLYPRGGSYETTIPAPLLFAVDKGELQDVLFIHDDATGRWYVQVVVRRDARPARGARAQRSDTSSSADGSATPGTAADMSKGDGA